MAKEATNKTPYMVVSLILLIISIISFIYLGQGSVDYLMNYFFNVSTADTTFYFIAAIIGVISSVILFISAIYLWNMKSSSKKLIIIGSAGFIIKNLFLILNEINEISSIEEATQIIIKNSSVAIFLDIFQIMFWIFIIIFISRKSFVGGLK